MWPGRGCLFGVVCLSVVIKICMTAAKQNHTQIFASRLHCPPRFDRTVLSGLMVIEKMELEPKRCEELWFDDGTLVIQAASSLFRVYKGILSSRSSVFRDMMSFPLSKDQEFVEGCPMLHLHDSAADTKYFLLALHHSGYAFMLFVASFILTSVSTASLRTLKKPNLKLSPVSSDSAQSTMLNIFVFVLSAIFPLPIRPPLKPGTDVTRHEQSLRIRSHHSRWLILPEKQIF
jgi:hypothetical protein